MFLHLIHADQKFLEPISALFESAAPGRHVYAYYAHPRVAFGPIDGVPTLRTPMDLAALLATRSDWEGIIVNGIAEVLGPAIGLIPPGLKVAWYPWGHEIYGLWPALYKSLYGSQTIKWVAPAWKQGLRPWVWYWQGRLRDCRTALERYDFCVCQLREELDCFQAQGLGRRMQYVEGAVGALEGFVDVDASSEPLGPDIQVGNSASFTNNFPEIFERLARLDLDGRKVVVPLSYGDSLCRDRVLEAGERILGRHFEPLVDFMPLDRYSRILQRFGTVVMNHNRQQALGNIMAALWRGARVYLNDTPVYRGYTRLGFEIGLIERDLVTSNTAFTPLSEMQGARHRELMWDRFSQESLTAKTRVLLERLSGEPTFSEQVVSHAQCS